MGLSAELRQHCADKIATYRGGYFHDRPWLRDAFLGLAREDFVPGQVWRPERGHDGLYPLLDRDTDPGGWLRAVYEPDLPLITQIDDGAITPDGPTRSNAFTSSISCAAVVVNMLHHLDPAPGERILEIGTGTGYNTALLCERVGDANVTTVEIAPELAAHAEQRLKALGHEPTTVTGDGEHGHPERAPYDRLISTAAVQQVPASWIAQVRPGGRILTPITTPLGGDALLTLAVGEDGTASGRLITAVNFMLVRGQRSRRPWRELGWPRFPDYRMHVGPDGQQITAP